MPDSIEEEEDDGPWQPSREEKPFTLSEDAQNDRVNTRDRKLRWQHSEGTPLADGVLTRMLMRTFAADPDRPTLEYTLSLLRLGSWRLGYQLFHRDVQIQLTYIWERGIRVHGKDVYCREARYEIDELSLPDGCYRYNCFPSMHMAEHAAVKHSLNSIVPDSKREEVFWSRVGALPPLSLMSMLTGRCNSWAMCRVWVELHHQLQHGFPSGAGFSLRPPSTGSGSGSQAVRNLDSTDSL